MGTLSRRKGANAEREVVALARAVGLDALRTWETSQSVDAALRCCDVKIAGLPCQVKIAANRFGALYDALDGVELLFVRTNRREWLTVLRSSDYFELLAKLRRQVRPSAV